MNVQELIGAAGRLVAGDKGLLAMDESNPTCNKRFARLGIARPKQETVDEVADATVRCLLRTVPAAVPGIAFLSGGQSGELVSARLNAMSVRFKSRLPWALAFSFARAIQQPALEIWQGKEAHVLAAQQALVHRARCNRAARRGHYNAAIEVEG